MTLADIRREYQGEPFDEAHADADPFAQFSLWFKQVQDVEPDPTAMSLATATLEGRPSVRIVLLKAMDPRGFVFFTNYDSRKAREMTATRRASLLFFWRSVERQVRIDGDVMKVSAAESDAYFATRPLENRLSAHASWQSEVLDSRGTLDLRYEAVRQTFADGNVPRPESWGGYRVIPDEFEFWQGRASRLHDRLQYLKRPDGRWTRARLAP
ncbi:MAG: pyridoxamine 5'-phosphate oxidase [Acidobacteria bacterium]|nr:pyridoxamine 5'-phosphate oxidase [Acidobacteriota bacterium]